MTWVKLCGLRTASDVAAAVDTGADAIGFVTAPGSPRAVSPAHAAAIGSNAGIERFLVTMDLGPDDLLAQAGEAAATGVQPHGRHSLDAAGAARDAGLSVLFPVPVEGPVDLSGVPDGMLPILDTSAGGRGVVFDWALATDLTGRFVLAGGLTPDNVGDALRALAPYGVDVSSGIEREHGVKDPDLMRRFVEAVR